MAIGAKQFRRGLAASLQYLANSLSTERMRQEKQEELASRQAIEGQQFAAKQTAGALEALRGTPEGQHQLFERAGIASPGIETLRNRQFLTEALRYRKDQPDILAQAARGAGLSEEIASQFGYSPYEEARAETERARAKKLQEENEVFEMMTNSRIAQTKALTEAANARTRQINQEILSKKNKTKYEDIDNAIDQLSDLGNKLINQGRMINQIPDLTFDDPITGKKDINPKYRPMVDKWKASFSFVMKSLEGLNANKLKTILPNPLKEEAAPQFGFNRMRGLLGSPEAMRKLSGLMQAQSRAPSDSMRNLSDQELLRILAQ